MCRVIIEVMPMDVVFRDFLSDVKCSAYSKVALERSGGMAETGPVVWHLALCLLLGWILIGAAMFKGIKSSGKVCVSSYL